MPVFHSFDVMIPKPEFLPNWPVVACDQFTSQPEYWRELRRTIGDAPSAIHCILPEAELASADSAVFGGIKNKMDSYLRQSVFETYPNSYVYVERTLACGSVRVGVVGTIDLEAYDCHAGSVTPIRATEETVGERIPPRITARKEASLDLSHVILLCDDEQKNVIEPLKHEEAPLLYDLDLPMGGGRIRGKLISGKAAERFSSRLESYSARKARENRGMLFAIGDGNHSVVAAKACYEWNKEHSMDAEKINRTRYALVEMENVYDDAICFEPIHRVVYDVSASELFSFLQKTCCAEKGCPIKWITGCNQGEMILDVRSGDLPAGILQRALDEYLEDHAGKIDYIHGSEALIRIAEEKKGVGFVMPGISKHHFFKRIAEHGAFPRKMFSMGEAVEKRYYLETRRI